MHRSRLTTVFASTLCVLAVAALPAAPTLAAGPPSTSPILGLRQSTPDFRAFTHATIHVAPGRTLQGATLVVRDGRVVAVGEHLAVPEGATEIDLGGKAIYPGFLDPISEYGLPKDSSAEDDARRRGRPGELRPNLEGERSGADSWNDAIHAEQDWAANFTPDAEAAESLHKRGVTVVQSARMDGVFRGRGVVATTAPGLANERILRVHGQHFASFDKGSSKQDYPSSLMGSIALVRQTLLDAAWLGSAQASGAEVNLPLAALAAYDGPLIFETDDELSLLRAARIADELGVEMIFVGSQGEYRRLDEIAALGRPLILPLDLPETPDVGSFEKALDVTLGDLRHWERAPTNAAALDGRGVRFAFTGHGTRGGDALDALRKIVANGLAPDKALASLTTVPAELLGVADQLGTLEPGKRAHFSIVDGDLFEDEDAEILGVWIDGEQVARFKNLDAKPWDGTYSVRLAASGGADATYELILRERHGSSRRGGGSRGGSGGDSGRSTSRGMDDPNGRGGRGGDSFGGGPSWRGELRRGKVSVDLDDVEAEGSALFFRADLDQLGGEGIVRFALRRFGDGIDGRATLADGKAAAAKIERTGDAPAKDDERGGGKHRKPKGDPADAAILSRTTLPNIAFGFETLPEPETVLIRGATLWTAAEDGILEQADLLIRDGKIAAIARIEDGSLDAPPGARVIDGSGLHVTPGMIDEHSHLTMTGGGNEESHAVTAEVRVGDILDSDDIGIYRALAGGTTTAQILHGSANPIGGQAAIIKFRWGHAPEDLKIVDAPPSIKFALGENVKQTNWGENFTSRYPQSRMGVETLMRDRFLAAREYGEAWDAWNALPDAQRTSAAPPRRDLQLETLLEILRGERFVHTHSYVQSEILSLMRLAEELGFRIQTFTHILEGYKVAPEMAAHGAGASTFADWWAYKFEVYDAIPQNTCLLHKHGVLTSINSDSAELIRRLNQEAGKSLIYCKDLDPHEALKFATINPAKQLKIDHRTGSLEVGKDADLVLWNGPPLSIKSRAEKTWVDGVLYFDRERDAELRRRDRAEKQALIQKALRSGDHDWGDDHGSGDGSRGRRKEPTWHCEDLGDYWQGTGFENIEIERLERGE